MNETEPKYVTLMRWIRGQIESGSLRPGDKLYSENELSRIFAISRQTVRQAISLLENDGLLSRVRGSGTYIGTAAAKRPPTKNIGVITTYLDDYIFPSIIHGIDQALTRNGYSMRLSITHNRTEDEERILRTMMENRVDGIILEPAKSAFPNVSADMYDRITASGLPCILINGCLPGRALPCVSLDDRKAGEMACAYLLRQGHARIGGVFKSDDVQGHLRYEGFARALKAGGGIVHDADILWFVTEDVDMLFGGTCDSMVLARLAGCTAVIAYNDQIAVKLIALFARHGLSVPAQVSVISFDDSDLAELTTPGLTSIRHPKQRLGETAAQNLLALIADPRFDAARLFEPELVERGSVAGPPPVNPPVNRP